MERSESQGSMNILRNLSQCILGIFLYLALSQGLNTQRVSVKAKIVPFSTLDLKYLRRSHHVKTLVENTITFFPLITEGMPSPPEIVPDPKPQNL